MTQLALLSKTECLLPGWEFEQKKLRLPYKQFEIKKKKIQKQAKSLFKRVKIVIGAIIQLNFLKPLKEALITTIKHIFAPEIKDESVLTDEDVLRERNKKHQPQALFDRIYLAEVPSL